MEKRPMEALTTFARRCYGFVHGLMVDRIANHPDVRFLGRTLLLASIVGLGAGLVGVGFFVAVDVCERLFVQELGGIHLLRAAGESSAPGATRDAVPGLIFVLPALGALLGGLVTTAAPEARGG